MNEITVGPASKAFTDCDTKEFAFTSLGIDYYRHTHQGFNMTYAKWFDHAAMSEYHTIWRLTEADVNEYFRSERDGIARVRSLVSSGATEEALELLDELSLYQALVGIRRQLKHPEALYREASVFYFDQTEDPTVYDEIYAEEKIRRWLQDPDLINNKTLFFSPVSGLMPLDASSTLTEDQIKTMMVEMKEMAMDSAVTATLASEKARMLSESNGIGASMLKNMLLRTEILRQYEQLSGYLSSNI